MTQKSFEIEFELSMDSCMFNKLIGNKAHEVGDNCFLDDCIMKRASLCKKKYNEYWIGKEDNPKILYIQTQPS